MDTFSTPAPESVVIELTCGNMNETLCAMANMGIAVALSGLTGIKAFIPIFLVAVGSKFMGEDFPLALADGSWLDSWPAIISLGVLLIGEMVSDCIPIVDEVLDAAMLFIKPVMAIIVAFTPYYGEEGSGMSIVLTTIAVVNAGVLSELMAAFKAVETIAVDAGSMGTCAPVRSLIEDIVTIALTLIVITVGVAAAIIILVIMITLIICWVVRRKMNGKSLCPRCWCCVKKEFWSKAVDDGSGSESEGSEEYEESDGDLEGVVQAYPVR